MESDFRELKLRLDGYTKPGQDLHRNVLLDTLYASLPRDPQVKVQVYNAEIAPGGYTNWHCHNGATFFVAMSTCSVIFSEVAETQPSVAWNNCSK